MPERTVLLSHIGILCVEVVAQAGCRTGLLLHSRCRIQGGCLSGTLVLLCCAYSFNVEAL